jgi:hypothetical protein
MPRKAQFSPEVVPAKKSKPHQVFKRRGSITKVERDFVTQFVQDQPRELSSRQVSALSTVTRRSKAVIKTLIEEARDSFVEQADRYVQIHREAVEGALESGDHEQAIKGSQWYLEHVSSEGARIVDKAAAGPAGTKIMLGISLGGMSASTVDALQTVNVTPKRQDG